MGKYSTRVVRAYNADSRSKQFSIEKWVSLGMARRVAPELYKENSAVAAENNPSVATPTPVSAHVVSRDVHDLDRWFGAFCHHTALIMVESKDLHCNLKDDRWLTHVFSECLVSDHLYPTACGGYRGFWAAHGINDCSHYFTKWCRYMCRYMCSYSYQRGCTSYQMEQYLLKCKLRKRVTSCLRRCKKRRGSCSSSSSSDSDDEAKDVPPKMERALPRLEPITSSTGSREMPKLEPITSSTADGDMPKLEPITSSTANGDMPKLEPITAEEDFPKLEPIAKGIPALRQRLQDQKMAGPNVPPSLRRRMVARDVPDLVPIEQTNRPEAIPMDMPKLEPLNAHVIAADVGTPGPTEIKTPGPTEIKTPGPAATVNNFMTIVNAYQNRCTDNCALTKGCVIFAPTNVAMTTGASKALAEGPTEKLRKFVNQYVCVAAPEMLADSSCRYRMANGSAVHVDLGRGIRDYPGSVKDTFIHSGNDHYMIMTHTNLFSD